MQPIAGNIFREALKAAQAIEDLGNRMAVLRDLAAAWARVDVASALAVAEGLEVSFFRSRALHDLAPVLAKTDPDRALAVAEQIELADFRAAALRGVATALAATAGDRAVGVARQIENPEERALALAQVAARLFPSSPERARELWAEALAEVAKVEIEDFRAEALKNLTVEIAPMDVEQALAAAAAIEFEDFRAQALAEVGAKLVGATAPCRPLAPRAVAVLTEAAAAARKMEDLAARAAELGGIAALLAPVDRGRALGLLDEAMALVGSVEQPAARATALREMMVRWAPVEAGRTRQLAEATLAAVPEVEEASVRGYTLRLVATALAGIDLEQALAAVQAIDLPAFKVRAWCDVALAVADTDPQQGRKLFDLSLTFARQEIDDPRVRDVALRDIVGALAEVDLDEALALAGTIGDAYAQARALVSVGRVAAAGSRFPT